MTQELIQTNQAKTVGRIVSELQYSHHVCGEGFYMVDVSINRLSDCEDIIPVMISENLLDIQKSYIGDYIQVDGQVRTHNYHDGMRNRLKLSVFARDLKFLEETPRADGNNQIFLDGYVCKPPIYRKTPMGREIADIMIAVNRSYGKSDYIPCICWGRNARFALSFQVGKHVQICGRIQSREYLKRLSEEKVEKRIAYEVSVNRINTIEQDDICRKYGA